MIMKRALIALALVAAVAVGFVSWPYVHGACAAAWDQLHGRRRIYLLGCEIGPSHPRDPASFRFEELMAETYSLRFEITGGFAPSRARLRYVSAYNFVTGETGPEGTVPSKSTVCSPAFAPAHGIVSTVRFFATRRFM